MAGCERRVRQEANPIKGMDFKHRANVCLACGVVRQRILPCENASPASMRPNRFVHRRTVDACARKFVLPSLDLDSGDARPADPFRGAVDQRLRSPACRRALRSQYRGRHCPHASVAAPAYIRRCLVKRAAQPSSGALNRGSRNCKNARTLVDWRRLGRYPAYTTASPG